MAKWVKEKSVVETVALLRNEHNLILLDPEKLKGNQGVDLRRSLRQVGARMRVVKNCVGRRVLEGLGQKSLSEGMQRMNALVWGPDPVVVLKRIMEFRQKNNNAPQVRGASIDGNLFQGQQLVQLSQLPPRTQLLGMLVGTWNAPVRNLAGAMNELVARFARALDAYAKKGTSPAKP
jgi:large subunit ribosomal protein L10